MYLSALLALKKGESQEKVVSLLNKTVELHLSTVRVCFTSLDFCHYWTYALYFYLLFRVDSAVREDTVVNNLPSLEVVTT